MTANPALGAAAHPRPAGRHHPAPRLPLRGAAYGCKPTPSIALAINSDLYRRMPDDTDIDCGDSRDGASVVETGRQIFGAVLRVAPGERTKSKPLGYGRNGFFPWWIGATM